MAACTLRAAPVYIAEPGRFTAAHGERAAIMGYPGGLEVWAYPLQIVDHYRLRFRIAGHVDAVDAAGLLRRVETGADEVVRVYVGPDYVVRERLFVPRHAAGAIIHYEVSGRAGLQVEVVFRPQLNLMWPAALGGQSAAWDDARSGYVVREPLHGFTAAIVSPDAISHDGTGNATQRAGEDLALLLQPRPGPDGTRLARLGISLGTGDLLSQEEILRAQSRTAVAAVEADAIAIETPDPAVNRALASAVLALDAAWVCNDALGCGTVAGYGASRPGRRPQYAWFFAGDGLFAADAYADAGLHGRARDELAFVMRYQDARTGMVWHEISQSAGLLNWRRDYPYMFVHVDISLQFLAAMDRYATTTGDWAFVRAHWGNIAGAWRYAEALIDPTTGQPRIPPGKQGQNEQAVLRDDLRLSQSCLEAADAVARLARRTGHGPLAKAADAGGARTRAALRANGWDTAGAYPLSGHDADGRPVSAARSDAVGILSDGVFDTRQTAQALNRVLSPAFMTDWGVRSLAADAPGYDPNDYGDGSVWGLGTATVATALWRLHQPLPAWAAWRGLVDWNTLDSPGHLHELMAGDLYHPEFESVPEQTWSSAALLSAFIHGLMGMEIDGGAGRLRLSPNWPPDWRALTVRRVRVGPSLLTLTLTRDDGGMSLAVENAGPEVTVVFAPPLPPGAVPGAASVDGAAKAVSPSGDANQLSFVAHRGTTRVRLGYAGGVEVIPERAQPREGDRSRGLRIASATVSGSELAIDAWMTDTGVIELRTLRPVEAVEGARLTKTGEGRTRLTLDPGAVLPGPDGYRRVRARVRLGAVPDRLPAAAAAPTVGP